MSPRFAKVLVRSLGTLAGLFGLLIFSFGIWFLINDAQKGWSSLGFGLLFLILPMLIAWYFLYAGWLVWFRFSPLAVRHVCGSVAFLAFGKLVGLVQPRSPSSSVTEPMWIPVAFLGLLWLVYFLYRISSERLNRVLFPMALSLKGQT